MALKTKALKSLLTLLRLLQLLCSALILGIYSYFLAVLADRDLPIATWKQAVEGISGAAVLYLIFAVLLTCFLGGKGFFASLAILLDILFAGAFIAIAVLTRDGVDSCRGIVETPLGNGPVNSGDPGYGEKGFGFGSDNNATYAPNLGTACRLNKTVFAVAIIGAVLFLISALIQFLLARHHRREKRYGPSPDNNYTSGKTGRKFWVRKPKTTHDAELGTVNGTTTTHATHTSPAMTHSTTPAVGLATDGHHHDIRPSGDTGYTGSTVAPPGSHYNKYEGQFQPQEPTTHIGYYTAPTGTAVNPYGYDNTTRGTATNY